MAEGHDEIRLALSKLDPKNDDHWTNDGFPRLDALGFKEQVKRSEVTAAAPLFTRQNPIVDLPKVEEKAPEKALAPTEQAEFDAVSAECAAAEKKLAEAKAMADLAKAEVQALEIKRDAALKKVEKLRPKNENQLAIQAVLERSKETRAAKAEIANELRRVGVTAKLLQAGSPLDVAMQRKRGFGLNRPNMNAKQAG